MSLDNCKYCVSLDLYVDVRENPSFHFETIEEAFSFIKTALDSCEVHLNITIRNT